ncbi:cobalt-precorrin 5A hydrolase [Clostridium sp.]|uniref:cobalt-precorrin 5A hydrolase n=1 Tax=Clostridium sp. TaxID=1506 RepID=UPI002FC9BB6D
MKIAVINVTTLGSNMVNSLTVGLWQHFQALELNIFNSKDKEFNFKQCCKDSFENNDAVIFISSTGIAVRGIAPHIVNKKNDPAVVVIDSSCKYAISLLSGHLGGANKLTNIISGILDCEAIITTATDNLGITAPDMIAVDNNLHIDNMTMAKEIATLLVEGKTVGFLDEEELIPCPSGYLNLEIDLKESYDNLQGIVVVTSSGESTVEKAFNGIPVLKLIRKNVILGIGCKKNFPSDDMLSSVRKSLEEKNIHEKAVDYVATVSIKKNETAILALCEALGVELKIFSPEEIKLVEHKYATSEFVRKTIGVGAVCEPVIELSKGEILYPKESFNGMTLAIGRTL